MEETKVRRQLGVFDATMLVMGGIVGSGIFMNPSVVAKQVHTPFLILGVWVAGGALALLGAFIWAELATRLPGAGGQYLYLREAYHPAVAFVYGWVLLLVTQTGGMAAVAVTFARYYREISGVAWSDSAIAAAVLLGLTAINCLGARAGSNVQSALMLLKMGAIAAMVVAGIALGGGRFIRCRCWTGRCRWACWRRLARPRFRWRLRTADGRPPRSWRERCAIRGAIFRAGWWPVSRAWWCSTWR